MSVQRWVLWMSVVALCGLMWGGLSVVIRCLVRCVFVDAAAATEIYPLSLLDALPVCVEVDGAGRDPLCVWGG